MGGGGVGVRLCALPGARRCRVTDQAVVVDADPGTDLRLLRARAQVVCAELEETRPVEVRMASQPAAGGPGVLGAALRRAGHPLVIATVSVVALAAIAVAPERPGGGDAGRLASAPRIESDTGAGADGAVAAGRAATRRRGGVSPDGGVESSAASAPGAGAESASGEAVATAQAVADVLRRAGVSSTPAVDTTAASRRTAGSTVATAPPSTAPAPPALTVATPTTPTTPALPVAPEPPTVPETTVPVATVPTTLPPTVTLPATTPSTIPATTVPLPRQAEPGPTVSRVTPIRYERADPGDRPSDVAVQVLDLLRRRTPSAAAAGTDHERGTSGRPEG